MKRYSAGALPGVLLVLIAFQALPALGATANSKACVAAQKKVAKEQANLDGVQQSIDSKQRALPNCTVSSLCTRFRLDLKALAKLKARHQKRIAKFTAAKDKACKVS